MNAIVADAPLSLRARAPRVFGGKLLVLLALAPFLSLCYYGPQWWPIFKPVQLPTLAIDRAVPFDASWIYAYMSMYVLILLPPLVATTGEQLRRFARGMALMFALCAVFFLACPIGYPRPPMPAEAPALYRQIAGIDQPINSLPSLHAGMTAYVLFYASRILADLPARQRRWLLTLGVAWAVAILYGTLATKQHYFVDLPTGTLVAWLCDRIVWRGRGVRAIV